MSFYVSNRKIVLVVYMQKKKGVLVAVIALLFLFIASPVYANDDHFVISTECNGVNLSKAVLYSGYTLPEPHVCVGDGQTYSGWQNSDPMSGLQLFTFYDWWIRIEICASDTITNVRLSDRFGAEFGVEVIDYSGGSSGLAPVLTTKGNSDKVFLNWNIGTICGGECASVWLHVWTDHNPAGKQEFTSYGCYYLNSGAVAKWKMNRAQYSAETGQIMIATIPPP